MFRVNDGQIRALLRCSDHDGHGSPPDFRGNLFLQLGLTESVKRGVPSSTQHQLDFAMPGQVGDALANLFAEGETLKYAPVPGSSPSSSGGRDESTRQRVSFFRRNSPFFPWAQRTDGLWQYGCPRMTEGILHSVVFGLWWTSCGR
jgi:hypothetical protein